MRTSSWRRRDWSAIRRKTVAGRLAEAMVAALSILPAHIDVRAYRVDGDMLSVSKPLNMRGRFATRLLQKGGRGDRGLSASTSSVAPSTRRFRPFVLASTSVGQEGLDFHTYCHRLVHWNLPSNPVDLEQRGRPRSPV